MNLLPAKHIQRYIHFIRGASVMLDSDLAKLYGVSTKALNQAVRRNLERFPDDFMFALTSEEALSLRSQFVTLETSGRGAHRKYLPLAFTEQGVAMLSGVLHSPQAVQVNISIMRAFISIRRGSERYEALSQKLEELERQVSRQTSKSHRQSRRINAIFDAITAIIHEREMKEQESGKPVGFLPGFRADEKE